MPLGTRLFPQAALFPFVPMSHSDGTPHRPHHCLVPDADPLLFHQFAWGGLSIHFIPTRRPAYRRNQQGVPFIVVTCLALHRAAAKRVVGCPCALLGRRRDQLN